MIRHLVFVYRCGGSAFISSSTALQHLLPATRGTAAAPIIRSLRADPLMQYQYRRTMEPSTVTNAQQGTNERHHGVALSPSCLIHPGRRWRQHPSTTTGYDSSSPALLSSHRTSSLKRRLSTAMWPIRHQGGEIETLVLLQVISTCSDPQVANLGITLLFQPHVMQLRQ